MSLIKCTECGKEISDRATACPHCGCPVEIQEKIPEKEPEQIPIQTPPKKKGHGCLTVILVVFAVFAVVNFFMSSTSDTFFKSGVAKYIDVSEEQGEAIDAILESCGIEKLNSIEHDEHLDNTHMEGESGYRLSTDGVDNIILYLDSEKNVYAVRYADYDLYANGEVIASLHDYCMTIDEASKWQIFCQEKIEEILKSPGSAKFPNILEWGFRKENNIITVHSYVDAQNSFGAEMRSEFQFIIDTDNDTIQSLIFDGQELISQ